MRLALLPILLLALTAWSPSKLATGTVKKALVEGGLSEGNAQCMANRMTDKIELGDEMMAGRRGTPATP